MSKYVSNRRLTLFVCIFGLNIRNLSRHSLQRSTKVANIKMCWYVKHPNKLHFDIYFKELNQTLHAHLQIKKKPIFHLLLQRGTWRAPGPRRSASRNCSERRRPLGKSILIDMSLFTLLGIYFWSQFACSVVALNRGSLILFILYNDTCILISIFKSNLQFNT